MSSEFNIPEYLENKLKDSPLKGVVYQTITDFCTWFENSRFPFFPEYSDHGTKHIEAVLVDAESLVSDDARDVFSPNDATILILSIILHDSAMHLTEEGFKYLIEHGSDEYIIDGFDDKPWSELYHGYLLEVRRFDDNKLLTIGIENNINHEKLKNLDFSDDDSKKVAGEFLRRWHHRLAHEIALFGVPGHVEAKDRMKIDNVDQIYLKIAGIIARSHGMKLRETFDYLENNYVNRDYENIHPEYLMVLLRIADYVQIQAERAPEILYKVQTIKSTVSQLEWSLHNVKITKKETEDPYAFEFIAPPENVDSVETYLRIKDYIEGLQNELDTSWAVLGEVYGRFDPMKKLEINIRRVTSNIYNKEFSEKVTYVPQKIHFKLAHSKILKLLVKPLYGDKPEVAIRELMQNSVDAVRERWEKEGIAPEEATDPAGDVIILFNQDGDGWYVEASDKGIGMTVDDINSYFLNIGSSFKDGSFFRENFINEDGKSKVLRSGRFGIGVLAAFLLCDETHQHIEVSTRHISEKEGVSFETTLNENFIELSKVERDIGTTIKVYISEKTKSSLILDSERNDFYINSYSIQQIISDNESLFKKIILEDNERPYDYSQVCQVVCTELLNGNKGDANNRKLIKLANEIIKLYNDCFLWNWYALDKPKVVRKIKEVILPKHVTLPCDDEELPFEWHKITPKDFKEVHWKNVKDPSHNLTINGIRLDTSTAIYNKDNMRGSSGALEYMSNALGYINKDFYIAVPKISVFDPDANFPLDVHRTFHTNDSYPFKEELIRDMLKDYLAFMLLYSPQKKSELEQNDDLLFSNSSYDYFNDLIINRTIKFVLFTKLGISFVDKLLLKKNSINNCILIDNYYERAWSVRALEKQMGSTTAMLNTSTKTELVFTQCKLTELEVDGYCTTIKKALLDYLKYSDFNDADFFDPRIITDDKISINSEANPDWVIIKSRDDIIPAIDFTTLKVGSYWCNIDDSDFKYNIDTKQHDFLAEWHLVEHTAETEKSLFAQVWEEVVGDHIYYIPYDMDERTRLLAKAYGNLAPYIEKHKALAKKNTEK